MPHTKFEIRNIAKQDVIGCAIAHNINALLVTALE